MTDREYFIHSLIEHVNNWLRGSEVTASWFQWKKGDPDILILELAGKALKGVREKYGADGKLLLQWMLPVGDEKGSVIRDWLQEGSFFSPVLFQRPEFKRKSMNDEEGKEDKKKIKKEKIHIMNLCPDLNKGGTVPAWFDYAKILWRVFSKKIIEDGASIAELARLEAGLNAIFVDSRRRTAARFEKVEAAGSDCSNQNPLEEIEARRQVKINTAWKEGGLGRLRIPHTSGKKRLCPFETPESKRIGLNLHMSADAECRDNGTITAGKRLLSVAVGMVPYPTHTDGPRLMMGGKNMKQAEPGITGAEPPVVPGYYEGDNTKGIKALKGYLDKDNRLYPYIGLNAMTVVMPFKGYTYEDGLVVSDSLAKRLGFCDNHYFFSKQFGCVIKKEDMEAAGIEKRSVSALLDYFKKEQDRAVGERFVYGDSLPGFKIPLYEEKRKAPFLPCERRDIYVHHAPGVLKETDIRVEMMRVDRDANHHIKVVITWRFSVLRPLALGDKLTGRNGNKGVVTRIVPDSEMPKIHFKGAQPIPAELIISPSSIMGRKNLGQIWEMTHSLLQKKLDLEEIEDYELPGDKKYASDVSPLFKRLTEIGADERGAFKISGDGVPEGTRAFAGWQYFCRLHHHSWKKLQARGEYAPFEAATGQPIRCGARTGQRLGEMENWSLLSHGANEVLSGMRQMQTGNFVKTRELLDAVLRSLGIKTNKKNHGLEFLRGDDNAAEETLQKVLDCDEHKEFHVTYVFSDSIDKKTGKPREKKTLQESFEEALNKIGGDKTKKTLHASEELLKSGFFDKTGGIHIETALLNYYPKLSTPLWKFFRGSYYEKVSGLIEYHNGLFEILTGKNGIPRRYLLSRRYNHSGRAVIVPEPTLMPHELRLPIAMLVELLDDYDKGYLKSTPPKLQASTKVQDIVNDCPNRLDEARNLAKLLDTHLLEHPLWCFAVRQPSLHRHSVQSFRIRCWEEPVIGLPSMVTPGFNADFDGDTMAVFLPPYDWAKDLSSYAIEDNPGLVGTGKSAFADGLDLALGWWNLKDKERWYEEIGETPPKETEPLSKYLPKLLQAISRKDFEERGKIIQELQSAVCAASTGAATLAPLEFDTICASLRHIEKKNENHDKAEKTLSDFLEKNDKPGLSVMLKSGAKGKEKDVLQMTWAIGEVDKMKDHQLEEGEEETEKKFISGNFWEGLTEDELFLYSYPSRYSMAQKKLSVATAGYLTRQLAEGLYEVTVEAGDCETDSGLRVEYGTDKRLKINGVSVPALGNIKKDLVRILWGRVPLGMSQCLNMKDIEVLAAYWKDGSSMSGCLADHLERNSGALIIRSPLHCRKRGEGHICPLCYGADLVMKPYDNPVPVKGGFAAGLTAAQAIGERGTQLAMKRFHDVAGEPETQTENKIKKDERNAIHEMRSLLVFGKARNSILQTLFDRVLAKEIKSPEADSELPQALIHFETALIPLAVKGVGLGEVARASGGRFLSALTNERIKDLLSKDNSFYDNLRTIKSKLIWEGKE